MTVAAIFFAVITIQVVSSSETLRIASFVFWAVYGVIPTIHWMFAMGGWDNPIVQVPVPSIFKYFMRLFVTTFSII